MRICTHCKDLLSQGYINESTSEYWHEDCLPEELRHRLDAMTPEELDESDIYYTEWESKLDWEQVEDIPYLLAIDHVETDLLIQRIETPNLILHRYAIYNATNEKYRIYTQDELELFIEEMTY